MPLLTSSFLLTALLILPNLASAIRFNISTPMQCDPLTVTWEDKAEGEMRLLIMPAAGFSPQSIITNITIPSSASSPYTIPTFSQPSGLRFIASLIDSSGYPNTGVTEILTVGSSTTGSSSCLITAPDPDFFFYTSPTGNIPQCGVLDVTWDNSYTLPASLVGLIPGGEIWTVHEITGPDQGGGQGAAGQGYDWTVNVREGTQFLLYMPNSGPVGSGGSTPLYTVTSGGSGCINGDSPSSISPEAAVATVSGVGGGGGRPSGSTGSGSNGGKSNNNTGAIVGGAVGGVAFIVLALIVLFIFLRKRARQVRDPKHPRNKLFGSYGTAAAGGMAAGVGGGGGMAGLSEEEKSRRRSSVVDLLAGEKPRKGSNGLDEDGMMGGGGVVGTGAGAGAGAAGARGSMMERNESDDSGTYEPSPFISTATPNSPGQPSYPRTSDELQSTGRSAGIGASHNRYSRESGLLAPMDFGPTAAGLGMAGMNNGPAESDSSRRRMAANEDAAGDDDVDGTLSQSGATIAARHPPVDSPVTGSPVGTAGRSNSTRKRRPLIPQNGDEVPTPTRFVLHQDAGMVDGAEPTRPDEAGVVEMPPRYDQLRSDPPS